jgi:hypothetical protein
VFCITLVLGSCLALRVPAADGRPAPRAAAVLPTTGELPPEVRRALTIELRRGLARRGYRLAAQQRVRKLAAGAPAERLPDALELDRIGRILGADIVLAARVEPGSGDRFSVVAGAVRPGAVVLGPIRASLRLAGSSPSSTELVGAAEGLLLALFADRGRAVVADGTAGPAPPVDEPEKQPADLERYVEEPARQPVDIERHDEGEWHDANHEGLFGDLSFLFSWCSGDLLCAATGTGYGGRLRLGWRIASYLAVSATAVLAGHSLPTSTDLEALVRTERMLLWYGFHGGLRGHPINRSWFDPFFGIDLGWTRLYYIEKVLSDADDCLTDYMGMDLCEYATVRNSLRMDGFTVTPQLGINFFVTQSVALGIVAEFLVPLWSRACNEVTRSSLGEAAKKDRACVDIEDADEDFLALEHGTLDGEDELPWHFDLELHLSFVF